ncbi:hypothetical protein [Mycolicibacterium gilvum]|uniref:hypothetical protein n=1 Tax=Mycolicibacterium gilvum TaxID=1804 RepID=UPI0040466AAF
MQKKLVSATTAACALLGGALGTAGPAWAHADDAQIQYKEPDAMWVMPDLKGKVLFAAEQEVEADVENMPLKFNVVAPNHAPVYNLENWVVCGESPKAGAALSQKTKSVTLLVERPGAEHCGA